MVIFGATGDLTYHKLMPALFSMFKKGILPKDFFIIGFSRREMDDRAFSDFFENLNTDEKWEEFATHLSYDHGTFEEDSGYGNLIKTLNDYDKKIGACITRFFYLATPPQHYENILDKLHLTKLSEGCGQGSNKWTRVIIEKPFGKDLETAVHLDNKLAEIFEEKQIFRVDHYLGKETVQNMIAFRFANGIFEPVWNKNFIDHVQVTFAETKGVEHRGKFFDGAGMLRDVMQNHLMQLVGAVAMEQPKSFSREDIRDARSNVVRAIKPIGDASKDVVRGQYKGYKNERDVEPKSKTETFAAFKLFVDTPRFSGVPFYLRAGKKMSKDIVEISIVFIQTCHVLFKEYGCPEIGNVLTIRIQPDEGISLRVLAKKPGSKLDLGEVNMKFSYKDDFGTQGLDAYEKVLMDIFSGDQMLFNRSDELQSSWKFITDILNSWDKNQIFEYDESMGPRESIDLIERDGKKWLIQ
jgi:glucose-6-phosphate 1-dehydrogenase